MRNTAAATAALVMGLGLGLGGAPADDAKEHKLQIYWTDAPPRLDGAMTEKCWQAAAVVGDFRTFQKPAEAASQQTEVRACYDAEHLYVFWKLYEARMDKLFYGPPEDMRDMLNFNGDVAELFFDPGKTREHKIQLCASPLGTRYDGSSKKGAHFNPDWRVKPAIHKDHWTLEVAVPFASLAHKDEFLGAPQVGEEWGVQFCRDQAHLHEWSQWKPTPRGFHEVDKFGTLVFAGRRKGPQPAAVRRTSKAGLRFGPGSVEFSVAAQGGGLIAEYAILHEGKVQTERVWALETPAFRAPYRITEGGNWAVRVKVRERGKLCYSGFLFTVLPPVSKTLAEIDRNIRAARVSLKGFEHPAAAELAKSVERLAEQARTPQARIRKAKQLSTAEWQTLADSTKGLGELWEKLRFDLHLVQLYPKSKTVRFFAVGHAGPEEKIYRNTLYEGDFEAPVKVSLAGGERESFQLVVIPFWRDLANVTVRFSDLTGPGGTVAADSLSHHLVDYVRLEGIDPEDRSLHEFEPDVLWPGKPFPVAKGRVASVWVDVHLPVGAAAGDYQGTVTVEADGQTVERKLTAHAYGFDLPKVASLDNNFWFGPTDYSWGRFYGAGHYGDIPYTTEIYEKHAKVLSRYRVTCFADSVLTMSPHFTIYREPDGSFSFDFSKWEEFIRIGLKYGSNAYRAALSCNLGALYLFRYYNKVVDRATGEEHTIKEIMGDWLEAQKRGEAYWDTHPIYLDYLRAYIAFMKRVGVLEMATWEIYDEPNSNPRWLDMIRHHKFLRKYAPELTLMDYGVEPLQRKAGKTALGLIDVWAPHLVGITPEVLKAMQERRERFGEQYWYYTCSERPDKDGNLSPFLYYHRSYLGPRIHAWYAWKLEVDGMLIFAMSQVPKVNVKTKNRDQQWPNADWLDGKSRGCGVLIYPGPDFELIPSMRLASVRDGLEDYEYFHELRRLFAYVDPEEDKDLFAEIERELAIEEDIIATHHVWTKDRAKLEAKRDRLAALIRRCTQMVADR